MFHLEVERRDISYALLNTKDKDRIEISQIRSIQSILDSVSFTLLLSSERAGQNCPEMRAIYHVEITT